MFLGVCFGFSGQKVSAERIWPLLWEGVCFKYVHHQKQPGKRQPLLSLQRESCGSGQAQTSLTMLS
jgi:hypothetical protein